MKDVGRNRGPASGSLKMRMFLTNNVEKGYQQVNMLKFSFFVDK